MREEGDDEETNTTTPTDTDIRDNSPDITANGDPNAAYDPDLELIEPRSADSALPTAEEILNNPNKLPSPPVEEEKPGGFEPFVPPEHVPSAQVVDLQITPEQMIKAQKYCKYAGSALNYDDVKTAIENLQKALTLLTTGQDV